MINLPQLRQFPAMQEIFSKIESLKDTKQDLLFQMFHPNAETDFKYKLQNTLLNQYIVDGFNMMSSVAQEFKVVTIRVVIENAILDLLQSDESIDKNKIFDQINSLLDNRISLEEKLQNEIDGQFSPDSEEEPLGKYAFSNARKQGYETPKEYDTKLEFKLCKHIEQIIF